MLKNKSFWKLFIPFTALLCLSLTITGYFASTIIKGYHTGPLAGNQASDIKSLVVYILLAFVITGIIGFIAIRINTSPLLNITQTAKNFARGNFTGKVEVACSGEMRDLADAINTMGAELQARTQIILDDKNKLDAIMSNMREAVVTTDYQERIILINNSAQAMFGLSKVEINKDYLWEKIRNEKVCRLVR
ncbi:MAG: HAMP domain-containing protein, partial [Planctomycetota bacterium]